MTYFYASYGSGSDHHVKTLEAYVDSVEIGDDAVDVNAKLTARMKDDSGHDGITTLIADAAVDQSRN